MHTGWLEGREGGRDWEAVAGISEDSGLMPQMGLAESSLVTE